MEKETRSALERATQRARRLLEDDFIEQLEGTYDVMRDGRIADKAGAHLKGRQPFLREKIVAAIEHKRAAGMKLVEAVADYVRDAAFTTLNRFVALKMLEARELVRECITRGDASSGFAEFSGLAPAVRFPDGSGYRLYLESIFDELSTEVKVLFDRRDPAAVLWPKKVTFEELLDILNAPDLAGAWGEDETIGWVYQYFNSGEERRAMREASQAPRNSRELAIRNQFFTPRYVVQFLGDNTLGRIWYEMRKGRTRLSEQCEYMVRQLNEYFAEEGEEISKAASEATVVSALDSQSIRVAHRPKKDPRDLRGIDPACGSGHFLLYLFDLLVTIYQEAWDDLESPAYEETGRTLREDYPNLELLHRAIPVLILKHNLYGVDIDPRCAQIAQLALWMRAQRAFKDAGVPRSERPVIRRSNIVIAEPMPGEKDLLNDFLRDLKEDRLAGLLRRALDLPQERTVTATKAMAESLSELVETIWDSMRLAGEMGVLLRVERDLARAVEKGREQWEDRLPLFRVAEYGLGTSVRRSFTRAVPGEQDDFWTQAEKLVFQALKEYATAATGSGSARRRLFADDAAQGFALVDLLTKRFDVVLMNPPFGAGSAAAKTVFERSYPRTKNDVYAAFVERGVDMLHPRSRLGAITSRTGFFLTSFQKWREDVLLSKAPPVVFADLGQGVLDGAMVETAAYCLEVRQ